MYKFILITLLSLLTLMGTAQAGGSIAVIVNSSNSQTLTLKDVADIYSDKKIKWENGKKIAVYTLPIFAAESESFWQTALSIFGYPGSFR